MLKVFLVYINQQKAFPLCFTDIRNVTSLVNT